MAKTELTKKLEKAIKSETSQWFGCFEVTIGWFGTNRVDYMTMDTKDIFRCYELKISKSDFHSKHGHTLIGNYNYYVMPKELYEEVKNEIPNEIGVYGSYEYNNKMFLDLLKRPKKQALKIDKDILKNSMIRSLYRDAEKFQKQTDECILDRYNRKISKLEKDLNNANRLYLEKANELYEYTKEKEDIEDIIDKK